MKRILTLLTLVIIGAGCSEYDDTALWNSIGGLDERVRNLEEICDRLNTNISSLQSIVQALESHDYITDVTSLPNNEGYTISFASGKNITIYHGKDGEDGKDGETPIIGVKQDTDGIYYWTINGEWLIVDGNKVKAEGTDGKDGEDGKDGVNGEDGKDGKDGITPQFKIEDDYWYISFDNGQSWEQLGKATGEDGKDGDSIFKEVRQDNDNVYFILSDDTVITIPKYQESKFAIVFETTDVAIMNDGETKSIAYTIQNANANTIVKTISSDGWKAVVKPETNLSGSIVVTAPSPIVESEILIFTSNGTNTLMSVINCMQGVINVAEDMYLFSKDGETIDVEVSTNLSYEVHIPESAQSWLSYSEIQTKAIRNETIAFTAAPNSGSTRYAAVELTDDGNVVKTIIMKQSGAAGNIGETTDVNAESLTVTNSICGDDIAFIRSMPNLKYLNLKDASIISGGEPYYELNMTEDDIVGDNMFNGLSQLETVILPDDVTAIGRNAFRGCSSLTSLTFGNSLTRIDESAFSGCYNLTELTFPKTEVLTGDICNSLKDSYVSHIIVGEGTIEIDYAFADVRTLRKIEIPQSVESMSEDVFKNCTALTDVSFASGSRLKRIGKEAFYKCISLESIEIPSSVETIGGAAFYECTRLNEVLFVENSKLSIIEDGYLTPEWSTPMYDNIYNEGISDDKEGTFADCIALQHINLPLGLQKIGSYAFARCENITSLLLPETLSEINEAAFAELGVSSITVPENVLTISPCLFSHCHNLITVNLGNSTTEIGIRAFTCSSIQYIDIPDSVREMKMQAFSYCPEIKSIALPNKLQTIGAGILGNSGITEIIIPRSVKEIEHSAFEECLSLEKVIFEEGSELQIIGGYYEPGTTGDFASNGAFKRCPKLQSIKLPASLKTIEPCAFYDCSSLSVVDASECRNLTTIGNRAFKDCSISNMQVGSDFVPLAEDDSFTVQENSVLEVLEKNMDTFKTSAGWSVFSQITALE